MFAFNNEQMSYISFAMGASLMVKHHMPRSSTAVITDKGSYNYLKTLYSNSLIDNAFDHVIFSEDAPKIMSVNMKRTAKIAGKTVNLTNKNQNTSTVYWLSPFDETLMLDADYLVQSDILDQVWGSINELRINDTISKLDGTLVDLEDVRLYPQGIKQLWTTAIYFRRTPDNDTFFNLLDHISANYVFYKRRYQFARDAYRNDFVFSIANHIMSGFIESSSYVVPLPDRVMITAYQNTKLYQATDQTMKFLSYHRTGESSVQQTIRTNVHVLDKYSIQNTLKDIVDVYG